MKNTIKPAQYDPYLLLTPSGNIITEQGIDFFNIYLSQNLNGNFSITGSLKINGVDINYPNLTNTLLNYNNGNRIFAGNSNTLNGSNSVILNGSNSNVSGSNNILLNGNAVFINGFSNSVALGNNISIINESSTVFGDFSTNAKTSNNENSLTLSYTGGVFVENDSFFSQNVIIQSNLNISGYTNLYNISGENISGLNINLENDALIKNNASVNSNLYIGQESFFTGNLNALSGLNVQKQLYVGDNAFITGTVSGVNILSSGGLSVSGVSNFGGSCFFNQNIFLSSSQDRRVPLSGNALGNIGEIVHSGEYLYLCTGTNLWGRALFTTW